MFGTLTTQGVGTTSGVLVFLSAPYPQAFVARNAPPRDPFTLLGTGYFSW
jgi:hypothetical protein